jgi:hypothetical protein
VVAGADHADMPIFLRWSVPRDRLEGVAAAPDGPACGKDWWEVLGVSGNAPAEVVRGAYRALILATVVSRRSFERIKQAYDAGMAAR